MLTTPARAGQKCRAALRYRHLKAAVELGHMLGEKRVGRFQSSYPPQSQLLGQTSLPGREAAF
jgi:hypothetical protein